MLIYHSTRAYLTVMYLVMVPYLALSCLAMEPELNLTKALGK